MNKTESLLLHLSTIALAISGMVYTYMHYFLKPSDPFSVVGNPWEPAVLKFHIIVAPVLILAVGMILHAHILFKLSAGTQTGKKSGILLIGMFIIMVLSGYVLQIVTVRKPVLLIHLISGVLWSLGYLSHQVSAYVMKKAMAQRFATKPQQAL